MKRKIVEVYGNRVSVAICTYNGEKYIREQLESIISQTVKPDEIIIVDDRSMDNTRPIIRETLEGANISWSLVVNEVNLGVNKNFEKVLRLSSGEIIFLSDQDDVWVENKIEETIKNFGDDSEILAIFSNASLVNNNLEISETTLWDTLNRNINKLNNNEKILHSLLKGNISTGATMAIRRELLIYAIPFSELWMHDHWLAIIASLFGETKPIKKKLILYRQHENNVIGAKKTRLKDKIKKYIDNFGEIQNIRKQEYHSMIDLRSKLSNHLSFTDAKKIENIDNSILFWEKMCGINSNNKTKNIILILREFTAGNYSKYYTGLKGAVRDLICLYI